MARDPFDFTAPDRYAVMGNPVAHSRSPRIHAEFARALGEHIEYTAIQVEPGGLAQAVDQFRANGGRGLNITVPFKLDAFRLADRRSARAELAGAVNTLRFDPDGRLYGDNTDGAGLVRELTQNLRREIARRRVLLLGAGGAVRGVLGPLLDEKPAQLVIANRTAVKAKELAGLFSSLGPVTGVGFDAIGAEPFDLVINGTAASLEGSLPPLPPSAFATGALACDMMYGDKARAFLDWALTNGAAQVADGLGMLVEQAAESYFVWRGKRPATRPVIELLRAG
jgi:shikimate dehydrogenase